MFFLVAKHYRVPSSAMEPTLHCARPGVGCLRAHQDRFIVFTFLGYGRRDLVVFQTPERAEQACGVGGVFVKRIVGMPGDVWRELNGYVYIDGKKLDEPYIKKDRRDFQSYPARKIPADSYFVMGDNRQSSCDSRRWGTVPRDLVIGKVFAIYWPLGRILIT